MRSAALCLVAAASMAASGCGGYTQSTASLWRDRPNYAAMSQPQPARAYHYGDTTVVEFPQSGVPVLFRVDDSNGRAIDVEQHGRFFRIHRRLDSFTAWVNGRAIPVTVRVAQAPVATEPVAAPAKVERVGSSATADELRSELASVRAMIAALNDNPNATSTDWAPVTQRLDDIEMRVGTTALPLVSVHFSHGSTEFKPTAEAARLLGVAAKVAESVSIKGFTDSRVAGPADPRIARGRAENARRFLVLQGVAPSAITVSSQPAGGFVASNSTAAGREQNRRVEIKFVVRAELDPVRASINQGEQEPM